MIDVYVCLCFCLWQLDVWKLTCSRRVLVTIYNIFMTYSYLPQSCGKVFELSSIFVYVHICKGNTQSRETAKNR